MINHTDLAAELNTANLNHAIPYKGAPKPTMQIWASPEKQIAIKLANIKGELVVDVLAMAEVQYDGRVTEFPIDGETPQEVADEIAYALKRNGMITDIGAVAVLQSMGYLADSEHTGGGTHTIYFAKENHAFFGLGPITYFSDGNMWLHTDELSLGIDIEYTVDESDVEDHNLTKISIAEAFKRIDQIYTETIAIGKVKTQNGGESAIKTLTNEQWRAMAPIRIPV